ncbi:DUF6941 family protein [Filimonas effusa]|uniref:Uncharacterized protein n=1 Tax=Filimonas effusa TaxID=2508721 RepID=A0A4Q1DD15_9BACT|nr:hypothetical protein [Filimonas effusa]RXK86868.1 hypothetical protein ESB13_08775 [Filimonas effusa]
MTCSTLLCAQTIITDKATNNVSVINIVENINASLFPIQIPISVLIATERKVEDPASFNILFRFTLNGDPLLETPVAVTFLDQTVKHNATINIAGLLINQPGMLFASVVYNGEVIKSTSLTVQGNG